MSNNDPFREASRYQTSVKRAEKWHLDYLKKIEAKYIEKLTELRATLSPAALRVVEAAEGPDTTPSDLTEQAPDADPEPQISPRLLETPPEVGRVLEVPDRPKRGARA